MRLLVVATDLGLAPPGRPPRIGGVQAMGRLVVSALAGLPEVELLAVWSLLEERIGTGAALERLLGPHRHAALSTDLRGFEGGRLRLAARLAFARKRFDHVMFLHLGAGRLGRLLGRTPFSVWLHGIEAWRPLDRWRRFGVEHARPLLSVSRFTAEELQRGNPGLPLAEVVPLACPDADAPARDAPAAPPPSRREPVVLVVGRLDASERSKGYELLLEAWPRVLSAHPAARLVFVGDGNDRARLEALAASLGLAAAASVRFAGRLDDRGLAEAYRLARVFALPSTKEGFGLVYVEAMREGLPCIACPGAPAEIVQDGETGLIVPPAVEPLARALLRVLGDPALADRMGAAGRARYEARYTLAAFRTRVGGVLRVAPRGVRRAQTRTP